MTTTHDEKYIVFKREEFFQMLGQLLPTDDTDCAPIAERMIELAEANKLEDAVVIRGQDKFAATAFDSYADSVMLAIDLIQDFSVFPDEGKIKYLNGLAEFFRARAATSREMNRKLPS